MTGLVNKLRSFAFPPRATMRDFLTSKDYVRVIDSNVRMIILTRPGEYVMYPDFGCKVWQRVFDQLDSLTESLIKNDITEAIQTYESRVTVKKIEITSSGEHFLNIKIFYEISTVKIGEVLKIEFNIPLGA